MITLVILLIIAFEGTTIKWKNNISKTIFWVFIVLSILAQIAKQLYYLGI